jgi:hypothetical protein
MNGEGNNNMASAQRGKTSQSHKRNPGDVTILIAGLVIAIAGLGLIGVSVAWSCPVYIALIAGVLIGVGFSLVRHHARRANTHRGYR